MPLELDELLARNEFGLQLATARENGCGNAILGAHSIETDDPARWMEPGWIILTDGSLLHARRDQQEFILRAQQARLCGIGLAAGIHFDRVPAPMLATANSVGMPVFVVPESVPFHRLVRFVDQQLLSEELHELQRLLDMQAVLIESAQGDTVGDPCRVAQCLSKLLGGAVDVIDHDGFSLGRANVAHLPLRSLPPVFADREYADSTTGRFVLPLHSVRSPGGWLSITWAAAHVVSRAERELLRLAGALIQIQRSAKDDQLARLQRYRRHLVRTLVDQRHGADSAEELTAELAAQGFDIRAGARLFFIPRDSRNEPLGPHSLDSVGEAVLWGETDHGQLLVCSSRSWRDIGGAIANRQIRGVGVSREFLRVTDGALAYEQARLSARVHHTSASGEATTYVCADDVSLSMQLALQLDSATANQLAERVLGPAKDHPELVQTLRHWLKAGRDITLTAQQLFLHPNSVRYRLRRLEQLLGRSLADASTLSDLYIATLIVDI